MLSKASTVANTISCTVDSHKTAALRTCEKTAVLENGGSYITKKRHTIQDLKISSGIGGRQ